MIGALGGLEKRSFKNLGDPEEETPKIMGMTQGANQQPSGRSICQNMDLQIENMKKEIWNIKRGYTSVHPDLLVMKDLLNKKMAELSNQLDYEIEMYEKSEKQRIDNLKSENLFLKQQIHIVNEDKLKIEQFILHLTDKVTHLEKQLLLYDKIEELDESEQP